MLNDEKNITNQEDSEKEISSENTEQVVDFDATPSDKEETTETKAPETPEVSDDAPQVKEETAETKAPETPEAPVDEPQAKEEATETKAPETPEAPVDEPQVKEETAEATPAELTETNPETINSTPEVESTDSEPNGDDDSASLKEKLLAEHAEEYSGAHDDYDWEATSEDSGYSPDEEATMKSEYEGTLSSLEENAIIDAVVSDIIGRDVVLDLNYKSDGILSISEFRDYDDLKAGDTVAVYVEKVENDRGQLQLSRRKAKILRAWESLVKSHNEGTIVKGKVVSKTKGGLIVDCSGLETFLPGSQIDIKPIVDYDSYVGKTMEFKVVKINEAIKNAVVSHKALIESDLAEQREKIIGTLERGQVLEGMVKNITDFGAFMDLGGVDGLLYITDISWGRIKHPNEVLEMGQKLNVVVMDYNEDRKRISLGLKQLQPHPWVVLDEGIVEGSIIKGKVVNIEDYGAFIEIIPGVEGLVHVSEVTWSNHPVNAKEYFTLGDEYEVKVVTISREDKKMSLSIKQLSEDPWDRIEEKYAIESKHSGEVKNLTPYGVFLELEDGIGGMIHISDLSWLKRYSHPSEFTKVGETIDVSILEIDKESRKLTLGHKQLEENPWDTFEKVFPVGSFHEGTIVRKDEKGAIVQLPYGLEALAPIKHVKKEDGKMAEINDVLTFKVLEYNRDDKRILVSHTRYLDAIRREAEGAVRDEKRKEKETTRKAVRSQQSKIEVTTLGEIQGFSELKEQLNLQKEEPKKEEPKKEEPAAKETKEVIKVEAEVKQSAEPIKVEATKKVVEAKKEAADDTAQEKDDLKKLEGIGPKIEEILNTNGVVTYAQLSEKDATEIKEWLSEAGSRFNNHNPATWPKQAEMAAKGAWEELKTWQDELDGGKE